LEAKNGEGPRDAEFGAFVVRIARTMVGQAGLKVLPPAKADVRITIGARFQPSDAADQPRCLIDLAIGTKRARPSFRHTFNAWWAMDWPGAGLQRPEPYSRYLMSSDLVLGLADLLPHFTGADRVALLRPLLEHEDPLIRLQAAWALSATRDVKEVPALTEHTRHTDALVRESAVRALGEIGPASAAARLSALLTEDMDWAVRRQAALALGKMRAPGSALVLRDTFYASPAGWDAKAKPARRRVVRSPASGETMPGLQHEEWIVLDGVAWALGELGEPGALKELRAMVSAPHMPSEGRLTAVQAIGKLGTAEAVRRLAVLTNDRDPLVAEAALDALGAARGKGAAKALAALLEEGLASPEAPPEFLISVARGLGSSDYPEGVQPLIAALGSQHIEMKLQAAESLGDLGNRRAVPPLLAVLEDPDSVIRPIVARALGKLGDARAVAPLVAVLRDGDPLVRESAARGLARLGDPRTADDLLALLTDEDAGVRLAAAEALGKVGKEPAIKALDRLRKEDSDEAVREAARQALGQISDRCEAPPAPEPAVGPTDSQGTGG
jgi:HEAT repeat protein